MLKDIRLLKCFYIMLRPYRKESFESSLQRLLTKITETKTILSPKATKMKRLNSCKVDIPEWIQCEKA